jgi:hypothetical protein
VDAQSRTLGTLRHHKAKWLKPKNRCLVPSNSFAEYVPEPSQVDHEGCGLVNQRNRSWRLIGHHAVHRRIFLLAARDRLTGGLFHIKPSVHGRLSIALARAG